MNNDKLYQLFETYIPRASKADIFASVQSITEQMVREIQIASNELRISVILETQKQIEQLDEEEALSEYKKKSLTDHLNKRKNEKLLIIQQGKDNINSIVESSLFQSILQKALYEAQQKEAN